jgi:signal transduction histidine kinase
VNYNKCNLNDLFTELVNFFENHKRRIEKEDISFSINSAINASEAHIITDTVKLKQILINLINNAFKFTDQGSIQCGCKIENNELLFHVTDTGIGIPPDKFETVFERFTQLRPAKDRIVSGTGLGLSIVKGLVSILGAHLVGVAAYKGTSFYFTIPYKKIEEPELKKKILKNKSVQIPKQMRTDS